jgi:hypothetical protein
MTTLELSVGDAPNCDVTYDQGDQIWAIFCQLGYSWRLIAIFWKDEVAQNNGNFLFKLIYYIFT